MCGVCVVRAQNTPTKKTLCVRAPDSRAFVQARLEADTKTHAEQAGQLGLAASRPFLADHLSGLHRGQNRNSFSWIIGGQIWQAYRMVFYILQQ